jgi:NAD(P) transhydrogenase
LTGATAWVDVAAMFDLVVLGGGPGGEKAAVAAAYFGHRVALVDDGLDGPGGATVHTGTLPSKTLRETALALTGARHRGLEARFVAAPPTAARSIEALMSRLPAIRATQTAQIRENLERHGVELVTGRGVLDGPTRVRVGDATLETRYVLVATGSSPRRPPQFDFTDPEVFDSDTLLALPELPRSLAVIGGGVIGSEYASVFATFGVELEVIERAPRLLSFLDPELSEVIMRALRGLGVHLHLDDGVERLVREGPDLVLTLKSGRRRLVDKVLVSAGRVGNTRALGLETVGLAADAAGLLAGDRDFRTACPTVFAVGDVIGRPALASSAMEQGRHAVAAMFGHAIPTKDFTLLASGIYTIPEAAACGPTEAELTASGVDVIVGRAAYRHNARGQIIGDADGLVKLVAERATHNLRGVHLVGELATELVHVGQSAIRLGATLEHFAESVMTYPSLSSAYKLAAYDALGAASGRPRPPPLA